MSYFWGVVAPWMVAFCFSQGTYFAGFINWSSLIVNGVVNFLIPLLLYLKAVSVQPRVLTGLTDEPIIGINSQPQHEHEYSTHYMASLTMAPSTVQPWPPILQRNARLWTIIFFAITAILVVAQIAYALYLISIGKSAFG